MQSKYDLDDGSMQEKAKEAINACYTFKSAKNPNEQEVCQS